MKKNEKILKKLIFSLFFCVNLQKIGEQRVKNRIFNFVILFRPFFYKTYVKIKKQRFAYKK